MSEWAGTDIFKVQRDEDNNCNIKKLRGNTWSVLTLSEDDIDCIMSLYKKGGNIILSEKEANQKSKDEHLSYEEVVERAKRYVKNTTEKLEFSLFYDVSFVVNAEKRTVVALLSFVDSGIVVHRGIAKAAPEDVFNEHIGKAIALGRVWGGDIPNYFLNALQQKLDIPNRKRIYFASPLFSNSEKMFNSAVVEMIRNIPDVNLEVYLPQENMSINDKSGYADSVMITEADNKYLEKADILVAVLDGQTVDAGIAAEVGYFYSMNKPIVGIYTDTRQGTYGNKDKIKALDVVAESQFSYINLYLIGLIKKRGIVASSVDEAVGEIIKLASKTGECK